MKKVVKFLGLVFLLILITGCGRSASKKDADKYLESNYPNEEFEYVGKERIMTRKTNECRSVRGNSYTYKSKETGVLIKVFETREATLGLGTCKKQLTDSFQMYWQ